MPGTGNPYPAEFREQMVALVSGAKAGQCPGTAYFEAWIVHLPT